MHPQPIVEGKRAVDLRFTPGLPPLLTPSILPQTPASSIPFLPAKSEQKEDQLLLSQDPYSLSSVLELQDFQFYLQ